MTTITITHGNGKKTITNWDNEADNWNQKGVIMTHKFLNELWGLYWDQPQGYELEYKK